MNRDQFISLATNIGPDTAINRESLANSFASITSNVQCAHDDSDAYFIAHQALYQQNNSGPIIEIGCFKGGMTAKLSLVAALIGKQVLIYDTFLGLIENKQYTPNPELQSPGDIQSNFTIGMYQASMGEINSVLRTYGNISVCSYLPGDVRETIAFLDITPSTVFIDVDNIELTETLIKYLWNKTTTGIIYFHEACLVEAQSLYSDSFKNSLGGNVQLGHQFFNQSFALTNTNCLNFIAKNTVDLNSMFAGL